MPYHSGGCCGINEICDYNYTLRSGFLHKVPVKYSRILDNFKGEIVKTSKFWYAAEKPKNPGRYRKTVSEKPVRYRYKTADTYYTIGFNHLYDIPKIPREKFEEIALIGKQAYEYRSYLESIGFKLILVNRNPNTGANINVFVRETNNV